MPKYAVVNKSGLITVVPFQIGSVHSNIIATTETYRGAIEKAKNIRAKKSFKQPTVCDGCKVLSSCEDCIGGCDAQKSV